MTPKAASPPQSLSPADGRMANPSQISILAEDERHQRFIRTYLYRLGHSVHELRFESLPVGRGSGEQWVRERYSKAVAAYRARSVRAETALVVVIDSDTADVERRVRQLQDALKEAELHPCSVSEKIVHLIPKRNIETWILCLNGAIVDEDADYRRAQNIDAQIKPAAETFFAWTRPNALPPPHCIPSLQAGVPEIRRLE